MSKAVLALLTVLLGGCTFPGFNNNQSAVTPQSGQVSRIMSAEPTTTPIILIKPITISLAEQSDSGQTGTVLFQDYGANKTRITITMTGKISKEEQPAHIHLGSCPNPGDIFAPLNNVVNGKSDTIVGYHITSLFVSPMAINVHKSMTEANIYMACGNLK